MRRLIIVLAIALSMSAAAPKKSTKKTAPPPTPVAPEVLPHPIALFLDGLSQKGSRSVTFKARAVGVRFFFEEPSGVTVYRYANGRYVREATLPGMRLDRVVARYASTSATRPPARTPSRR